MSNYADALLAVNELVHNPVVAWPCGAIWLNEVVAAY